MARGRPCRYRYEYPKRDIDVLCQAVSNAHDATRIDLMVADDAQAA
jgi:hypothetical protein